MVWISNEIWNLEAQPFEIWTNDRPFVKNHLKSGQKSPYFEWNSFQMFGITAIELKPTIWKQDHLKSDLQKAQILNVSLFWMVGFQIHTVL